TQVYDTKPLGVIPKVLFVPEGQSPPPSVLRLRFRRGVPPKKKTAKDDGHAHFFSGYPDSSREIESSPSKFFAARAQPFLLQPDVTLPYDLPALCETVSLFLGFVGQMNTNEGGGRSCARSACAPAGSAATNRKGCCLDYNGPLLDGKPYNRK